jgi:GNAT superfamily N-acetyltransferase
MPPDGRVERLAPDDIEGYRWLYRSVGERWHWRDRLGWDDDTLRAHLASPSIAVWELRVDRERAGYFELHRSGDAEVEIAYFGLVPSFIGRGFGGALLGRAVQEAWNLGADRVWLHTCTLDSPNALPNYRARGFQPYRTEQYETDLAHPLPIA